MSRHARLYTEMVVTGAIVYGDRERFLDFNAAEHPVALQLGGSDPAELAASARIGQDWGYDEINLNCGCPSDRVQKGKIGAVLMNEPGLVAECVAAMIAATSVPVTIKHRIGVDDNDDYDSLCRFIELNHDAGCETFIVHARKAWLKGLSPKENREIPPLDYSLVESLKLDFPDLNIIVNGGITSIESAVSHLHQLDGVMMGREAYSNPFILSEVDSKIFGDDSISIMSRDKIIEAYAEYCERQLSLGKSRLHHMSRHVLGLYSGQPGGKLFRRYLSEHAPKKEASAETLLHALDTMRRVQKSSVSN